MKNCDKCGQETGQPRGLSFEPKEQPGCTYPVGTYGVECFYVAAAAVRQQGHRPLHTDTGREVFQRART